MKVSQLVLRILSSIIVPLTIIVKLVNTLKSDTNLFVFRDEFDPGPLIKWGPKHQSKTISSLTEIGSIGGGYHTTDFSKEMSTNVSTQVVLSALHCFRRDPLMGPKMTVVRNQGNGL